MNNLSILEEHRWILLLGASRGIGYESAKLLGGEGYCLALVSRSFDNENAESIEQRKEIESIVGKDHCRFFSQDLSMLANLDAFAKKVQEEIGPLDGLVYCAGMQKTLPLSMTKSEIVQEVFTLNTFAAIEVVRLFSKNGFFNPNASFVLLSSLAAHEASSGKAAYAASKAALEGFLCAVCQELASKLIRINAIAPGIVATDMSRSFLDKMSPEQVQALESTYPLGFGRTEDVAWLIEFLLSPRSRWVTGKTYLLDGGHLPGGK